MPGFTIGTGTGKNNKAEFRRKHRWRVARATGSGLDPADWLYLQKAARPSFKYLEAVVHHDQEQAYFAGKQEWEAVTMTFYDTQTRTGQQGSREGDISKLIYEWIAAGASKNVGTHEQATVELPTSYKLDLELEMTDGGGDVNERWTLFGAWPMTVNWQDLDYTNTEVALIEVQVRFDRAQRTDT